MVNILVIQKHNKQKFFVLVFCKILFYLLIKFIDLFSKNNNLKYSFGSYIICFSMIQVIF